MWISGLYSGQSHDCIYVSSCPAHCQHFNQSTQEWHVAEQIKTPASTEPRARKQKNFYTGCDEFGVIVVIIYHLHYVMIICDTVYRGMISISGSVAKPDAEMTWPKYLTFSCKRNTLLQPKC